MNYGSRATKPLSITHTLPNGQKKKVCTIPMTRINRFREKMLKIENEYCEGKERLYTNHTKNPELAILETALDYLAQIGNRLVGEEEKIRIEMTRINSRKIVSVRQSEKQKKQTQEILARFVGLVGTREKLSRKITGNVKLIEESFGDVQPENIEVNFSDFESPLKILYPDGKDAKEDIEGFEESARMVLEAHNKGAEELAKAVPSAMEKLKLLDIKAQLEIELYSADDKWLEEKPESLEDSLQTILGSGVERMVDISRRQIESGLTFLENELSYIERINEERMESVRKTETIMRDLIKQIARSMKKVKIVQVKGFRVKKPKIKPDKFQALLFIERLKTKSREASRIIKLVAECYEDRNKFFETIIEQVSMLDVIERQLRNNDGAQKECDKVDKKLLTRTRKTQSIKKKMKIVESMRLTIEDEIGMIKTKYHIQNARRRIHLQNSPKTKGDGEIMDEFKKEYNAPKIKREETPLRTQDEYIEIISKSVSKLSEQLWSHGEFKGFCNNGNSTLKPRFRRKIRDLARIYIENDGKVDIERMQAIFSTSMKHENLDAGGNTAKDFRIVRIVFANKKKYRFLVGIKEVERPIIYFIGDSDGSHKYVESIKYKGDYSKTLGDGRANLFPTTLAPAIEAYRKIKERSPNFSLF